MNAAAAQVDEEQHVDGHPAECRPNLLREEIAGPESLHVPGEESVPIPDMLAWAGMKAVFDQDVFDRVPGDHDAELEQFTLDARVAPSVLPSHAQDDFYHCLLGGRTPANGSRFPAGAFLFHPNPAEERLVMNDIDQVSERNPQTLAQPEQDGSLDGSHPDQTRNPGAEKAVFSLEIGDLAQQSRLGQVDQEQENGIDGRARHEMGE